MNEWFWTHRFRFHLQTWLAISHNVSPSLQYHHTFSMTSNKGSMKLVCVQGYADVWLIEFTNSYLFVLIAVISIPLNFAWSIVHKPIACRRWNMLNHIGYWFIPFYVRTGTIVVIICDIGALRLNFLSCELVEIRRYRLVRIPRAPLWLDRICFLQ